MRTLLIGVSSNKSKLRLGMSFLVSIAIVVVGGDGGAMSECMG